MTDQAWATGHFSGLMIGLTRFKMLLSCGRTNKYLDINRNNDFSRYKSIHTPITSFHNI